MPNAWPRQANFAPRRGFAPRPQGQTMLRPQGQAMLRLQGPVTPGITQGPGFINNATSTACPNPRPLAPMELQTPENPDHVPYFPNPHVAEDGAYDMGNGWTDNGFGWTPNEYNSEVAEGYEAYPTGNYSYGPQNF